MILFATDVLAEPLVVFALGCIVAAASIVLWYLIFSPPLVRMTKMVLLFGIAVFPIGASMATSYVSFETTTHRSFCAGCHLMTPYTEDSTTRTSTTLASRHARNETFGPQNCYRCHSEYGMFGTILTKLNGMKHVYYYYIGGWKNLTIEDSVGKIHIAKPFRNKSCMVCHSTETPYFNNVNDHKGALSDIQNEVTSCASEGCHGPAHPFSKVNEKHGAAAKDKAAMTAPVVGAEPRAALEETP